MLLGSRNIVRLMCLQLELSRAQLCYGVTHALSPRLVSCKAQASCLRVTSIMARGPPQTRATTSRSAGAGRRWWADTCSLSFRMSDRPACTQSGRRSSLRKFGGRRWGPVAAWTRQVPRRSSVVLGSVAVQSRRAVLALTSEWRAPRERRKEAPALAPMACGRELGSAETRTPLRSRHRT